MAREDISLDQVTGTGAMVQMAIPDRIVNVTDVGEIVEDIVDKIVEKGTEIRGMVTTTIEIGTDLGRSRDRSSSNDWSRSGSRASTNRDRIRCYTCREYDHFVRNCPNSREERDLEQLQHMLTMEEQDHRSLSTHSSDEDYRSPLNL